MFIFILWKKRQLCSAVYPTPHHTVDAYGVDGDEDDEPIDCIHVYENSNSTPYKKPRAEAKEVGPCSE